MEHLENCRDGTGKEGSSRSTTPDGHIDSPEMDRNPSPPPDGDGSEGEDAIGETVYSKHWLFSVLTRLIEVVKGQPDEDGGQMELSEEQEDELCKVWDMAMDEDVAGFLQEFKAPDILLGVMAKSCCPRLTEICVGILGNMACFPDTCLSLSQNSDLCDVLLLLLGDNDPPTLLETCRLLLTCISQPNVASLWLDRIRQQAPVCSNLCFIMCSSTNVDLLLKVGELVDKLMDEDEELMKGWLRTLPSETERVGDTPQGIASALLEAAKQLRCESPEGLEVYLHALQLLTTVDEGVHSLVSDGGCGTALWTFVSEVVCDDLCQPDDPPLILHEQKGLLAPALALLSALYSCLQCHISLSLVGSVLRILQYHTECVQCRTEQQTDSDREKEEARDEQREAAETDVQLQALEESAAEFLSSILTDLSKDVMSDLVKKGLLTERNCLTAAKTLIPQHSSAMKHWLSMLSESEPNLADVVRKECSLPAEPNQTDPN
ncbi:protein saal1 [Chanos chanos]|uniref:Protein saal1 n=1 Tax=Chanos chanos TaxID=29144 RepID=A0A6J2WNS7_CHACN|nr:protein SAAL1 [Chanos chanos]